MAARRVEVDSVAGVSAGIAMGLKAFLASPLCPLAAILPLPSNFNHTSRPLKWQMRLPASAGRALLACPHLCEIAISSLIILEAFHERLLARSKVVARP
jgi:hypothetical protein